MKRIFLSLLVIVVAAAVSVGGTVAFFSDTETSGGNTFTAGGLDLRIDSEAHYNGLVCVDGFWADPYYVECGVNMISNASFEVPVVTHPKKWDIFPDGHPDIGWQVEWESTQTSFGGQTRPALAQLEYHRGVNGWNRIEDQQYTELDSDWQGPDGTLSNEPASVRIIRVLDTVPGKTYEVSFWFSARPNTPASDNVLEVVWGNSVLDTLSKAGASNTNWEKYTYEVVADAYNTNIEFADKGTPNSLGTFLDDVQVQAVNCEIIPGQDQPCNGTWTETDLEEGIHKFFDFADIKPGDHGEDTISLHVYDNDAWGQFRIQNIEDLENTCLEPELDDEPNCLLDDLGELREATEFKIWLDQGEVPGFQNGNKEIGEEGYDYTEGDNLFQEDYEPLVIAPGPVDLEGEVWDLDEALAPAYTEYCSGEDVAGQNEYGLCHGIASDGRLVASVTYYFGLAWELPFETGNETQSDSFVADMVFAIEQHRNNPDPFAL